MDLTYEQIMDYYRCPLLYKFKHELKLDREQSDKELYNDSLQKTIMYFYYQVMNGNVPSYEALSNKWFKMASKNVYTIEDIIFRQDNTSVSNGNFRSEYVKLIKEFYEREVNKTFTPIVVDTDIRVQIGDYHVMDSLELVREIKLENNKNIIELVRFNSSIYKPISFLINHDFKLTLQAYAFRKLFKAKEDRLVMYGLKNGYITNTTRNEDEFKRLTAIINNVGNAIEEQKFHPITSRMCKQCQFIDVCDKYKF